LVVFEDVNNSPLLGLFEICSRQPPLKCLK
jgi:hypothetical protein